MRSKFQTTGKEIISGLYNAVKETDLNNVYTSIKFVTDTAIYLPAIIRKHVPQEVSSWFLIERIKWLKQTSSFEKGYT